MDGRRLLHRLGGLAAVLVLVSAATFLLTELLPGDAAEAALGPGATAAELRDARVALGLDRPLPVRYVRWVADAVTGDLGRSLRTREPVSDLLGRALPVTLELLVLAQAAALAIGVLVAVLAARRPGGRGDRAGAVLTFGVLSIPQFVAATVLVLVFAVRLDWFPAVGYVHLTDDWRENLRALVLPTLTLALPLGALYARVLRADLLATMARPHAVQAEAMGVPRTQVVVRHGLRASSLTLLTVAGLQTAALLGGALVVERVFALPGVGRLVLERIGARDHVVVQGVVLVVAVGTVAVNALVDVAHGLLDPRIRRAGPTA